MKNIRDKKSKNKGKNFKRLDNKSNIRGKLVTVDVVKTTIEGKGVVSYQGEELAVADLLEGETAVIAIDRQNGQLSAKVVELKRKSDRRVVSPCSYYEACGGCQLQHLSYKGQLDFKSDKAREVLRGLVEVRGVLGMDDPWNYRNKNLATFAMDKGNRLASGFYQEFSHKIVEVEDCLIQDAEANAIIKTVSELAGKFGLKAFDEDRGHGFLRHVLIRRGYYSGEVLVTLVVASSVFKGQGNFVRELVKRHSCIKSVVLNVNNKRGSVVLGREEKVIYGPGFIEDSLLGLSFRVSSSSFYQINTRQTEVLYTKASELAGLKGSERVIDAYCGTGTIGIIAAGQAKEVVGVELNRMAIRDAVSNARRNRVGNVSFVNQDAGEFMVGLAARCELFDVVFVDPPRSGCSLDFLRSLVKLGPERVVYISCSVESLARDLEFLKGFGYVGSDCFLVDLFPWTYHVETVVLMSRCTR